MKIKILGNATKDEVEQRIRTVVSAGLLSRSEGTVTELYNSRESYEANLKIIKNILASGHKSITEHDYLVFALENVTPIVEQIIIGYRLTSFTINSRRNVDFGKVGYYKSTFHDKNGKILENNDILQKLYNQHMNNLFNKYTEFINEGIPLEDARYILPYSFHSNIIMGADVHELFNMACDMAYGKNSNIPEVKKFGNELIKNILEYAPYMKNDLEREKKKDYYEDKLSFLDEKIQNKGNEKLLDKVKIIDFTYNGDWKVLCQTIQTRYNISYDKAEKILIDLIRENKNIEREIMNALIHSKNQRELESVVYTFEFPISLAVLTHITRHRMHSLMVPDFAPLNNLENYIIPDSISKSHKEEFERIFKNNKELVDYFKSQGVRDEDLVYFYLSGNALNVSTTINARSLEWISRMRCCNKAQWEIRNIVKDMVKLASYATPIISKSYGASCDVLGYCPEGKDSCKNRGVVVKKKNKVD